MERIRIPFGFNPTADEVLEEVDFNGLHAIVTGAASGIEANTAVAATPPSRRKPGRRRYAVAQ